MATLLEILFSNSDAKRYKLYMYIVQKQNSNKLFTEINNAMQIFLNISSSVEIHTARMPWGPCLAEGREKKIRTADSSPQGY